MSHRLTPSRRPDFRPYAVLAVVFVAGRLLAGAAGLRFDLEPLGIYWQLADPELLRRAPWSTAFTLHAQPPFFNLLVGLALQTGHAAAVLHGVYLAAGFAVQAGAYRLLRFAGLGRWTAVALASALVLRPGFLLLETWLIYDHLVTALLVLAALALLQAALHAARSGPTARSVALFVALFAGLLAVLALLRAFFHLFFVALAVGGVLTYFCFGRASGRAPSSRRALLAGLLAAGLVPVAVVAAFYTTQWVRYDVFGASSWLGLNLSRVARASLDDAEIERLHRRGLVTEVFTVAPFSSLESYERISVDLGAAPGDPELLRAWRKSSGAVNYHHRAWIRISRVHRGDAVAAFREEPGALAESQAKAVFHALRPLTDVVQLAERLEDLPALAAADRLVRLAFLPAEMELAGKTRTLHWGIYLFVPFALAAGIYWLWTLLAAGRRDEALVVAFLLGTVLYVLTVGTLFEVGENQRFRAYVDPFLWVLAAGGVGSAIAGGDGGKTW